MAGYYDLNDIVTTTLFNEQKKRSSNIDPTLLRNYPYARRVVKKSMVKEQGGLDVRFQATVQGSNSARGFGPYDTVTRTVGDHQQAGKMQLRNIRADFSFDILEPEFNQGEYQILDVIDVREEQCMISLTKLIESCGWSYVASPGGDDELPQGFLYWLPYTTSDGFTGTVPSGSYTTIANINPSTYTGWKSYGATWANVTEGDLVLKMDTAFAEVDFESPVDSSIVPDYNTGNQFALYMGLTTRQSMESLAKAQNDNLGFDIDPMSGRALFKRVPLTEVKTLSDLTRATILGVNWGLFKHYVKRGWWMKRMKVAQNAAQPLVMSVDMFCVYQLICFNRRMGGFNLSKAA